jgi:hypothetical protein
MDLSLGTFAETKELKSKKNNICLRCFMIHKKTIAKVGSKENQLITDKEQIILTGTRCSDHKDYTHK